MKKITLLLLTAVLIIGTAQSATKPKYIFYFIGDGMGFAHIALAEATLQAQKGEIGFGGLVFAQFPITGYATTHAATRLTTDSAAAGTALAVGEKTSIGTIGMNADFSQNLRSIAVKAKEKGMKVGVATSVSIDHATPAAFYAHDASRNSSYNIGTWAPRAGLDLYAGSGFLKPDDGRNLYEIFADSGYTVIKGSAELKGKKVVWVQADGQDASQLAFTVDENSKSLTLPEITAQSIQFLENKNGFFLMVEGGKIDWAAHSNDAAAVVGEVENFSESIALALEFYKRYPQQTLIVITADHETGGLALGVGAREYDTNFEFLANQKMSLEVLTAAVSKAKTWPEAKLILTQNLGLWSKIPVSTREELEILAKFEKKREHAAQAAIQLLNQKAGAGWTTMSHTAGYVPVFAIGQGAERFAGRQDNVEIPRKIWELIK